MPFREKTAWVMTLILTGAGVYYFQKVASLSGALGETAPPVMAFLIGYVVLVVLASIAGNIALAIMSPKEAEAPADEREKVILDKAGHWSGYIMAVGVISALLNYAVFQDGHMLFHAAFGSLMASQIAEYLIQIVLYRRGV